MTVIEDIRHCRVFGPDLPQRIAVALVVEMIVASARALEVGHG